MPKYILCIAVMGHFISFSQSSATDSLSPDSLGPVISSYQEAVQYTSDILGIAPSARGKLRNFEKAVSAPIGSHESLTYPFLHSLVDDSTLWCIEYDSVDIRTEIAIEKGDDLWQRRNFECLIAPSNGGLVTVRSSSDFVVADSTFDSRMSEVLAGVRALTANDPRPPVSFMRAITKIPFCAPAVANRIDAFLVVSSSFTGEPLPYWYIVTWGTSVQSFGSSTSIDGLTTLCIVDATTGQWISGEGVY